MMMYGNSNQKEISILFTYSVSCTMSDLKDWNIGESKIRVIDDTLIYRIADSERKFVKDYVRVWEINRFIQKSRSPFGSSPM